MAIDKRGDTDRYQFQFSGERIQQSAQTRNKDAARQIEAAHRVRLAKGEAGIVERPPAPVFSPAPRKWKRSGCSRRRRTRVSWRTDGAIARGCRT
jgi:hypothetical protein